MKRKQLFAVLLAGMIAVTSAGVPVFAETEETVTEEAAAEEAGDSIEAGSEEQTPVADDSAESEDENQSDPEVTEATGEEPSEEPVDDIKEPSEVQEEEAEPEEDDAAAKVTATEVVSDASALAEKIRAAASGEITVITVSGTIEIGNTITIPSGKKISIITLDQAAVLTRSDAMKNDLFVAESGSFLTFLGAENAKLTLDGSGNGVKGSLISMKKDSQVSITGNVVLTGNKSTEAKAGAIMNEGGVLVLDGGKISKNQGTLGAVYTESDVILGSPASAYDSDPVAEITFEDNKNVDGEDGNLVLAGDDTIISVACQLIDSKVGVSFEDIEKREDSAVIAAQGIVDLEAVTAQVISLDAVEAYADYLIDTDGILQRAGEPESVVYTLAFAVNGGTEVASRIIPEGSESVDLSDAVSTRDGYEFAGWYKNAELTDGPVTSVNVTEDLTLYADWTKIKYTLTLDVNGGNGSIEPIVAEAGVPVNLNHAVTRDGYEFTGWYKNADGTGTPVDDPYIVSGNETLYAGWAVKVYTVTFDLNLGGSGDEVDPIAPETVAAGNSLDLSEIEEPEREKYAFRGWYASQEDAENAEADPVDTLLTITEDTTIYAGWIREFEISFDVNGGDAFEEDQNFIVEEGEEADISDVVEPTRTGYVFTGWYLTEDADGDPAEDTFVVNEDITLYAGWEKQVTLTYNTNGGTEISPVVVAEGASVTLATPKREGYSFVGWYTASDLSGSALGKTFTVNEDTTVYAKWTDASYTLSFDSNGGSSIDSQTVAAGASFDLTAFVPERSGYKFIGWYLTKSDNPKKSEAVGDSITIDTDTTLYAGWERKAITPDVTESSITGLDGVLKFGLRITSSGKVQGDSVNFTAVGAGTDITSPVAGDVRWVPICWNMDPNKYNSYTNSSGVTVSADRRDVDKNGKYTLTLNPTKAAIDSYMAAAKENPELLEDPEYFGSASNPKTKAAVYVYFRRQEYEEGSGWVDKNVVYIRKPIKYYMVLEKENGTEYTKDEIQRAVSSGGGVDALANENDPDSTGSTTADGAKTEDRSPIKAMSLLLAASFLTGCGIVIQKRKKKKAENRK